MRFAILFTAIGLFASVAGAQLPQAPEPTQEHEILKKDVGVWTGTMKMVGPDGQAMEMPVRETNTLFGGGIWLLTEFESGPFQGRGQMGYDPKKKKYVGTWIDNMNPYMSLMEGEYDEEKKQMVMAMEGVDPATGKSQKMKTVSTIGEASRRFTMYAKQGDTWQKAFEIQYDKKE